MQYHYFITTINFAKNNNILSACIAQQYEYYQVIFNVELNYFYNRVMLKF